MINEIQRYILYLLGLLFITWLIWFWNRGAQRRRFNKVFPKALNSTWSATDKAFLRTFETAFRLHKGWAQRLAPETTPMQVYLTLYPEHCIYDAGELARLTTALTQQLGQLPPNALSLSLRNLSDLWNAK